MEMRVLEEAAKKCGELLIQLQQQGVTATDKDDVQGSHFVTEGDEKSQALGIKIIHQHFPEEVTVAEEQDYAEAVPVDCTVFDPLDGTTLYYNGGEEFGVTLCTLRHGKPVMGVIYIPVRNIFLTCEQGKGVYLNGKRLPNFAWKRPLDKTMLGMEVGAWVPFQVIQGLAQDGFMIRSIMAAIYDAVEIILMRTGAYTNLNAAKIWDVAAGSLMIQELGGIACDPWGKPLSWNKVHMDWVWAVNQEIANAVLKHTKKWTGRE